MGDIKIDNLSVIYNINKTEKIYALLKVNLEIRKNESIAIVGESGCGKTTLALSMINLLPFNASITGKILINNKNIFDMSKEELKNIRGVKIGMIFQNPFSFLNPIFKVGEQILETILEHFKNINKKEAKKYVFTLLEEVGFEKSKIERIYNSYPHQLSGGENQRIMIAIALSCDPDILIADEPTTALDVTIQAQIIKLLKELKKKRNLTIILITHDLYLAKSLSDRIIVMYGGEIVEDSIIKEKKDAHHPYTRALFNILPDLKSRKKGFEIIEGEVFDMKNILNECYFGRRCKYYKSKCSTKHPELIKYNKKSYVRCFFPLK